MFCTHRLLTMYYYWYFQSNFFSVSSALCSVTLLGRQYCRTDIGDGTHADPGDMITINCEVDNPNDVVFNILIWSIPSQTLDIDHLNDEQGDTESDDVNGVNFISAVISSDDTEKITNASLTFLASSFLDEAVVICTNAENIMNNCTLFIKSKYEACWIILLVISTGIMITLNIDIIVVDISGCQCLALGIYMYST